MYLGKLQSGRKLKTILIIFVILAILMAVAVFYISTAKAIITIIPKEELVTVDFELIAKHDPQNKNEIFGRQLTKEITRIVTFEDVDSKTFPNQASGKVIIYNQREADQPLLKTTQLKTADGIIFRTQKRVVVPAGGQVEVEVIADQPGIEGNIEPQTLTIVKIWSAWQNQIYAENNEKFTGGTKDKPFVNQATLDRAKETIASQLFNEIKQEFLQNLKPGEILSDGSIKQEILKFEPKVKFKKQFDDTQGAQINKFVTNIKVRIQAISFDETKAKELAEERLRASTPSGNEFLKVLADNFNFKVTDINTETEATKITFHLEGNTRLKLPQIAFAKTKLVGRDFGQIKNYYREIPEVADVEISFAPFWVSSVPSGEEKIEIRVK